MTPEERRAYDRAKQREYRERDPEKFRERARQNYARNREKRLEEMRRYREANRERINEQQREASRRRWEENGDEMRERAREHYASNREKIRAYNREWYANNREKWRERYEQNRNQKLAADRLRRQQNQELYRTRGRERYQRNREQSLVRGRIRRFRANHGLWPEQLAELWDAQGGLCYLCGEELTEERVAVDHDHSCCPEDHSCQYCRRGLTHANCNAAIGFAGDDPARLHVMAEALEAAQLAVRERMLLAPVQDTLYG
jgi:hypothetical protein